MISIKYDFAPLAPRSLSCIPCEGERSRHLYVAPLSLAPLVLPLIPRGGNPGFNPFPYNFLPMHREKLARNTHAHARTAARAPLALARSLAVTDY